MSLNRRFARVMDALKPGRRFALAVSGGGDSLALMHLAAAWAKTRGAKPVVLTVDHGLVRGSAAQVREVLRRAEALGLAAFGLAWRGEKPKNNLEEAAREARYRLMGAWCRDNGVSVLMLAHAREDQAETFLMRLARGSGVDGLSAMAPRAPFPFGGDAPVLLRPVLSFARAELRAFLKQRGIAWFEDPMNADPRFARARIRALLPMLDEAGLSPARIAAAADHLARARAALETQTTALLERAVQFDAKGRAVLDRLAMSEAPREIGLRALAATLGRVGGRPLRPRFTRLERLFDSLVDNGFSGATLMGCRLVPAPRTTRLFGAASVLVDREPARKSAGMRAAEPAKSGRPPAKPF